ncbi:MAG: putative peptidoglycan lipid flippase, partial [Frankiaceae bacterium]|nr:putative peptidoglycan lipid flippase [Frankiaceae bacterium]
MAERTVVRTAAVVAAVTVVARLVGFLRTAVLGRVLGATFLGDTYTATNALPNVVYEIVAGGALAGLVVPVLAGVDAETARRSAGALLSWTVLVLSPLALLGVVFRRPLAELLLGASPQAAAQVYVGARFLAVFAPQVVLYGIGIVCTGMLQSNRRFLAAALAPLFSSVVVIGAYLTFAGTGSGREIDTVTHSGELLLAVGTTLGVVALTLTVAVPVLTGSAGWRPRPSLRFPPGVAPRVRRLALAGVVGVGAQQVSMFVALRLAAGERGAVVVFTLGTAVFLLPWAVLAVPVATSSFPELSTAASAGDETGYASVARSGLRLVLLCGFAGAGLLVAVASPLARLLLEAAPGAGVAELRRAVVAFAPGLPGYAVLAFATRALYARNRSRAAAVATSGGWLVVVAADIVLVLLAPDGWRGAALGAGNAIGMTVAGLGLLVAVRRAAGAAAVTGLVRAAGTGLVAATAGAVFGVLGGSLVAASLPALVLAAVLGLL